MQQVTIGTKNQVVIPQELRRNVAGLKPGRKVSMYVLNKNTVAIKVSDTSWLENSYGKMKNAWKKKKASTQLEKMRNEWDEK
jgi:bifunctional DNA-binding transcriptional regulator/antitoxin component of YhaV-PrlF toxin-antitoxin module